MWMGSVVRCAQGLVSGRKQPASVRVSTGSGRTLSRGLPPVEVIPSPHGRARAPASAHARGHKIIL